MSVAPRTSTRHATTTCALRRSRNRWDGCFSPRNKAQRSEPFRREIAGPPIVWLPYRASRRHGGLPQKQLG